MAFNVRISPRPEKINGGDQIRLAAMADSPPLVGTRQPFVLGSSLLGGEDLLGQRTFLGIPAPVNYSWSLTGPGSLSSSSIPSPVYTAPATKEQEQPISITVTATAGPETVTDTIEFVIAAAMPEVPIVDPDTGTTPTGPTVEIIAPTTGGNIIPVSPNVSRTFNVRFTGIEGNTAPTGTLTVTDNATISNPTMRFVDKGDGVWEDNFRLSGKKQEVGRQTVRITFTQTGGDMLSTTFLAYISAEEPAPDPDPIDPNAPYVRINPSELALQAEEEVDLIANVFNVPGVNDANVFVLGKSLLGGGDRLTGGVPDNSSVAIKYTWSAPVGRFEDINARETVFFAPMAAANPQSFAIRIDAVIEGNPEIRVSHAISVVVASETGVLPSPTDLPEYLPPVVPPSPPIHSGTEQIDVVFDRNGEVIHYNGQPPTAWLRGPMTWTAGRVYDSRKLGRSAAGIAKIRLQNNDNEWDQIRSGDHVAIYIDGVSQWGGFVDQAKNVGEKRRQVREIRCLGALAYLKDLNIHIPPNEHVTHQQALNIVYNACGVPHRFRGTTSGAYRLPWFWWQGMNGKEAAHAIETTVRGFLYEDTEGKIVLEARESRRGSGLWTDITGASVINLNDNWERRKASYQGFALRRQVSTDNVVVSGIAPETPGSPFVIPMGGELKIHLPRYSEPQSVGVFDLQNVQKEHYKTVGGEAVKFDVRPYWNGVEVTMGDPRLPADLAAADARPIAVSELVIYGKHLFVTAGVTQYHIENEDEAPEHIPCHLIQSYGEINEVLDESVQLTRNGERVDLLHWWGGRDRALAKDLRISQRLRSTDTDSVYVIEGFEHTWRNGKRHTVNIVVTQLSTHSNIFILGDSRLGSEDVLI